MILKQLGRLLTAVILAALPSFATVQVSAHLTDPSGSPASVAYIRFDLANCGFNVPNVPSQPLSVVWKHIDLKPNKTTGIATGTIFGNDEILCGGSQSSLYHVTAFSDANTAIAGDQDYLIEASLGAWEFSAANPFTGNRPPPGFQVVFANPTANQRIVQPSGTSLAITGTFDLTNATVIGFTGSPGSPGLGISVNGSNVNATALNFGQTPAAPSGALNVTWQRDALNPANASAYVMGSTSSAMGVIQLGGDFCSSSTATVPTICSLHLPAALSVAQGGTGQASAAAAFNALAPATVSGGLIVGSGVNTYANLAPPAGTKVLQSASGVVSWATPAAGSITAGTTNLLPKYTDGTNSILGNSGITDSGTTVSTTEIVDLSGSSSVKLPSNTVAKGLNKTLYADQFAGATADVQINAAITALPASGGTVDATGFAGSTVTLAAQMVLGSSTKPVLLKLDKSTCWNVTATGNIDLISVPEKSAVVAEGISSACGFQLASTAVLQSVFSNADKTGAQAHFYVKGVTITGSPSTPVSKGLVYVQAGAFGNSAIEEIEAYNFSNTCGILLTNNSTGVGLGPVHLRNNWINGSSNTGAKPLCITATSGGGLMSDIDIVGGLYEHSGPNQPNIDIEDIVGQEINGVNIDTHYMELSATGSIGIKVNGARNVRIPQMTFGVSSTPGADCIQLTNAGGGSIDTFTTGPLELFSGCTNLINDVVHSVLDTSPRKAQYTFPNAGVPSSETSYLTSITSTGTSTFQGVLDASAATSTILRAAAGSPNNATCTVTGQEYFQTDGTAGQEKWFCKGGVWSQQLNSGAGGASTTLNNLGTTAINAALLPSGTQHLGSATAPWADIFIGGASGNTGKLTGTFTANRVITFPDATDTVAELGQANVFTATNTFNANVQLGASGRVISGATGAPTSSCVLCFGNADRARYGTNSYNLIGVTSATGPVQIGDTPGISVLGPITSVTNGQNLSMAPLVAPTNTAGGSTTVSGGNGNGTGANGDLILGAGSGGAAGTGFVQLNSGALVPCANSASGTTLNSLASYSATGCVTTPHGSTLSIAGVCVEGCGTTGTAKIARIGSAPLTLDNSGTQGDYVCISSSADGKGTDCGTSPTTQTVGAVQTLQSGSLYNVDVNVAGVSSSGAAGSVVLAPAANQTIQSTGPTVPSLTIKAPASAGSTQVIAQIVDNTGANAFNCQQSDTCQVGAGVGGTVQLSHVLGPNANPATVGMLEASSGDVIIGARNFANNADLTLTKNSSDEFAFTAPLRSLWLTTTTGPITQTEIAAPGGTASATVSWGDSTTHWPSFNPNNTATYKYAPIPQVNTQVGTTYTVVIADDEKLVNFTSGSSIAVTLPQSTGVFGTNFCFRANAGGAGTVTITPTTSTINGGATLALSTGKSAFVCTDGSGNYIATVSTNAAGSGDMIKNSANTMGASGTLDGSLMSSTAGLIFPKAAGAIPTSDGVHSQDTTLHLPVFGNGTSTRIYGGEPVNSQSGTSYTILTTDANKALVFGNAGAVAVTLPQAGASFPNGWQACASNTAAGLVTITPTTSTIDGAASVSMSNGQSFCFVSNGTNYFTQAKGAQSGLGDPGGNGFVDRTASNTTAARTLTGTANQISITNGGGGGNPVFSLDTTHVATDSNSLTLTNKSIAASEINSGVLATAQGGVSTVYLTSAYTNATTTPSNITDGSHNMAFSVLANTNYTLECHLPYDGGAVTAGLEIVVTGPASPTAVTLDYFNATSATLTHEDGQVAFGGTLGTTSNIVTGFNKKGDLAITLINGSNAGTIQVQGRAAGTGTVTIAAGATCSLHQ